MERVFFLDDSKQSLYEKLYTSIIKEIYDGELSEGDKMPSIRHLSKSMNLSRTTVENTYSQLVAEGYLYSMPKKGFYVASINRSKMHLLENDVSKPQESDEISKVKYDFAGEYVEDRLFDMNLWKKNINKVFANDEAELYSQSADFGEDKLKEAIVSYFTRIRGIHARKEQVIIGPGTLALFSGLALVLKTEYSKLAIENPGFSSASHAFSANGYNIQGIPLKNKVLNIEELEKIKRCVLITSPSYQFPYGEIMPVGMRHELLDWANETESYIIEDDYNNELRYVGKPVSSLQGMDVHERVIYLGSFSTLLAPSIRISFLVLPNSLLSHFKEELGGKIQSASKLEQLALAEFIDSGDFGKHIRRLRKEYKKKYDALKGYLDLHMKDILSYHLPLAGQTCVLYLKHEVDREELLKVSYERNVNILPISSFMVTNIPKKLEKKLVLNYRGIRESELEKGIITLKELICQLY